MLPVLNYILMTLFMCCRALEILCEELLELIPYDEPEFIVEILFS